MARRFLLLLLPLLAVACRRPETRVSPPRLMAKEALVIHTPPQEVTLDLELGSGLEVPEALRQDLTEAFVAEMKDWGLRPAAPGDAKDLPRLKVKVTKYRTNAATTPGVTMGVPGVALMAAGGIWISATRGGMELAALATLPGIGMAGCGLALLTVGSVLGGRQVHFDKLRGYSLQPFKARARMEWVVRKGQDQDDEDWKETYRHHHLAKETRPLPPEAARDPAQVRREMMRVFALKVHRELGEKRGWPAPPEPED